MQIHSPPNSQDTRHRNILDSEPERESQFDQRKLTRKERKQFSISEEKDTSARPTERKEIRDEQMDARPAALRIDLPTGRGAAIEIPMQIIIVFRLLCPFSEPRSRS